MRVLFLIPSLQSGGAERFMINLLSHIDLAKFTPILAVINLERSVLHSEIPAKIELIDLKCSRVRYALPKIIYLAYKLKPDLIFSTLGHLNLYLAIFKMLLPRKTRFIGRETSIVSINNSNHKYSYLWNKAYKIFYKNFDIIICQSKYMQQDLITNYAIPQDKLIVINNPVDNDKIKIAAHLPLGYKYNPTTTNFISVGRLSTEKGFDILLKAIAICANKSITLTIIGSGPLMQQMQSYADKLEISHQVRFLGSQPMPYNYIANADALILPSRYEGFPNVVLESLACNTPVIATPAIGGLREILESQAECIIADAITAESLAQSINKWLQGMRARVPDSATRPYNIKKIVRRYENIIINCVFNNHSH